MVTNILWFDKLGMQDLEQVGGKNSSLGEMITNLTKLDVLVPSGFATTADSYRQFITNNKLDTKIFGLLKELKNTQDSKYIKTLPKVGSEIREAILKAEFSSEFIEDITNAYAKMEQNFGPNVSVAVRSSATSEDLPDASFAGQQETVLNVKGIEKILQSIKAVFASLFNDRAISYRTHQGFEHEQVAISAGVQKMVRSDLGASGVMFTLDTESGFKDVVFITSSYGLGETVVQGSVNPDEFYVFKDNLRNNKKAVIRKTLGSKLEKMVFSADHNKKVETINTTNKERCNYSINENQIEELGRLALKIENHYKRPMDIEWALDGESQKLMIVQARPETVESRRNPNSVSTYSFTNKPSSPLVKGKAIGRKIASGKCNVIASVEHMHKVQNGDILITDMTDPDWEPVMKKAAAIVTNRGGRTCHAAIIARELGIPAIVGCGNATKLLAQDQEVTASCAEGDDGYIYNGLLDFEVATTEIGVMPNIATKVMMNIGNPSQAFSHGQLPNDGVGLARLEFIISSNIGIHPLALINYEKQTEELKLRIDSKIVGYASPVDFYIDKITEGVATIAASFANKPVIVRMSDFKSNEYAALIGGSKYEPTEENPMIGYRGVSRYLSKFKDCFELECRAIKKVREEFGFTNVQIMMPFVRTIEEAKNVIALLKKFGLERGKNNLKIIMMCELPSNVILAEEFLEYFDGFSIGSNDMTQLTLGLDRDSGLIAHLFDERNLAVKRMLKMAIQACLKQGKYVGICGQGPSDYPELASWLLKLKITSISLNPDAVVSTWKHLSD